MNKTRAITLIIAAAFLTFSPTQNVLAQNNTPVGYWQLIYYLDNAPNFFQLATQHICFYPNNTWKGTFPNWHGRWFQKGNNALGNGDRVRLLGNYYSVKRGNDSAELDFVNLQLMTGTWTEWEDIPPVYTSFYAAWMRVKLTRVSNTCPPLREAPPTGETDKRLNPAGGSEEKVEPQR